MSRRSAATDPVSLVIFGAGNRGSTYAQWVTDHPERARIVAVADPDPIARRALGDAHQVAQEARFTSWKECAAAGRLADAALITTQDSLHVGPALAALELGYDVLLEKPVAPTEAEVRQVTDAALASGAVFGVCHVMRYTEYTKALMGILADDAIGELVSVQHLEPVGWWHYAHSYVRGNWRRASESSSMLLAKSSHDLDWLQYVVGRPIVRVASFGALRYFTAEHAPEGAAKRCLDCPLQDSCAYSATRIYLGPQAAPPTEWPTSVLTEDRTREGVVRALRDGPYGRCVYHCDNDVVDHQVVALEFAGGVSGTFTMTAFTDMVGRKTRLFGTQGMIEGDGRTIRVCDFRTGGHWTDIDTEPAGDMSAGGGHGGGDAGLMDAFVAAVAIGDQSLISSDAITSESAHLAVFAAEESRRTGRIIEASARLPS